MQWHKTAHRGIRYREHPTRKHGRMPDRYFNVRFRVTGISINEGYGWSTEGMSASKAALLAAELKEELRTGAGTGRLADRRRAKRKALETEQQAPTVTDLWSAYQATQARKKKQKAVKTTKEELRYWRNVIEPALGYMKVAAIKPMDISALLDKVADKAPVSANRLYSLLSVMFKTALQKGWITIHPLQWLDKPGGAEPPRKRVLSDNEIRTIWPYFDQLQPNPRDILKLSLLTAQRSGEIMAMRWSDVDMEEATWTQMHNKTDTVHIVPLSTQVLDILTARERQGPWIFPSRRYMARDISHTTTTKDARWKVQELSGVKDWTNHDLRRSARTLMSRLNIKHHVRERVLNHSQNGISSVYDQYDYLQEKRDALTKLAREIYRIIGQATKAEVIKLKTVNIR